MRQGNGLPPDTREPLVLSTMAQSGAQITATNPAAEAQGLSVGMTIADARAIYPSLLVEPGDEKGDYEALCRLALWCQRYSPFTRIDEPDGICIDSTGCAHLFGGETGMAEDIADRLHGFGLTASVAISPAIGASWALARYGASDITIVPAGATHEHIAPLPVSGLRLEADTVSALKKLGLRQIGMLTGKPRAPLASRFGRRLVTRLDQALGLEEESFNPLFPPPAYRVDRHFVEPVVTLTAIEEVVHRLTRELARTLEHAGKGARRVELSLYRVDGWVEPLALRTSSLSRDARHLARLLCERLDTIRDHTGFGFEAASLSAFDVENFTAIQQEMAGHDTAASHESDLAQLLDRLVNRFGPHNVTRFVPRESYLPERTARRISVLDAQPKYGWSDHNLALSGRTVFARPLLLLDPPEPIEVIVEMPDKPPAHFTWRGMSHRVMRADGPERIAPEWWVIGDPQRQTRDYYRVEDREGNRFWLYRDGLHERAGDDPHWFMHGLFP